jgi:MoxR-like ATPase
MKIKPLKESILLCRASNITPFIWGHRGLGKSQITEQTAIEHKLGFSDWRLSQCEASDLRGLPLADVVAKVTRFLPPSDLPTGGLEWPEYMEKLDILETLKGCIEDKELSTILLEHPTMLEDANAVIQLLSSMKHYVEADKIARRQAEFQPQLNRGIVFLDELNRAQDDVLQAVFQLVLDHRLGGYVLPEGWSIVCAGNFMEGQYMTNGFTDAAFLDRFTHLTLDGGELTLEEWVGFMTNKHGDKAADIIEFAAQNTKHLDGDIKGQHGFSIQPSRRSWDAVVRVEEAYKNGYSDPFGEPAHYSENARMAVVAGLVGREVATAFTRYSCPVRPRDLIAGGVTKYKDKLVNLSRNEKTGLCWGLVSFLKGKVDIEKNAKVAMDFAKFLAGEGKDKDIAVAFCNLMVGGTNLTARAALVSNPAVAKLIGKFRDTEAKKTFADRLNEDPVLQTLVSKCAWGSEV